MHVSNDPIPKNRMRQFHEILCATGGRYTSNPRDCGDVMRVDYAPGDYRAQNEAWRQVTTDVKEVRKDQWWRRMLRRMFSNAEVTGVPALSARPVD